MGILVVEYSLQRWKWCDALDEKILKPCHLDSPIQSGGLVEQATRARVTFKNDVTCDFTSAANLKDKHQSDGVGAET